MAFEIVDGMTGTKHISSDDLAALNTATIGEADCVLKYGNDFALTMASANAATLGTGVGMVGGKRFWNQAPTSLTVQSGTQGQKRNDLVVARYAKTSAGIESVTPVVIKGTPTTGTPADPATTANDLKLWRVPLDGINAGTPVRLFEPVTPLATLGDSVSRVDGWAVVRLNGVAIAVKTITAKVNLSVSYTTDIFFANVGSTRLPSGVFSSPPACSAAVAIASATCWVSPVTDSTPSTTATQSFRVLSSSNSTVSMKIMVTAIGA